MPKWNRPSPNGQNGRDGKGRFTKGNPGGTGNPHARKVGQLRSAMLGAVTQADMRAVVGKLVELAKEGSVQAAREVIDRCIGKPIEADLNEVVTTTLAGLDGVLKASVVEDLHPVPRVSLDLEHMEKVLTNLVLNAYEATGDRGEIRVITGWRDTWAELSVSDNGCGMPQEFMEQCLFRPFKTTKKQGMGIGLFHSRMIVRAHKGRMEVESQEGVGTTFRVLLPTV